MQKNIIVYNLYVTTILFFKYDAVTRYFCKAEVATPNLLTYVRYDFFSFSTCMNLELNLMAYNYVKVTLVTMQIII